MLTHTWKPILSPSIRTDDTMRLKGLCTKGQTMRATSRATGIPDFKSPALRMRRRDGGSGVV